MGGPITITVEYGMRESYMVLGGIGGGGMVLGGIGGGGGGVRWDRRGRRWC